ncbi:4-phosphopantoate--beta-alanine ligase [Sulfuracidifex tepidarius]|uniref:4-phosphopantoate--beta-alanine ligase n=1 Tax=Sulfuracidifex tepidarius TaxID=1294262 RepID=A0A510DZ62_9CREN|nr:phosphopantothenate/pantothenate synthetase [Sulfuracidifex tepidarius]BBG25240.1 4-phosphopantoate--beta-alanine ligase [Sulfuracidifex tepidarius]
MDSPYDSEKGGISSLVPENHPRRESLLLRERLTESMREGSVVPQGLIAHGRGECFDYLLGERTNDFAMKSINASAALLLISSHPVISVNGNMAALTARELVKLSKEIKAPLEVNLFYRNHEREVKIERTLKEAGAEEVLGVGNDASATIPELFSERRRVSPRGILVADTVFLAMEDGDRTEALTRIGKKVIAVDLNPLSRTSLKASITIVDNVIRVVPLLIKRIEELKGKGKDELVQIVNSFDNRKNLREALQFMSERLNQLALSL